MRRQARDEQQQWSENGKSIFWTQVLAPPPLTLFNPLGTLVTNFARISATREARVINVHSTQNFRLQQEKDEVLNGCWFPCKSLTLLMLLLHTWKGCGCALRLHCARDRYHLAFIFRMVAAACAGCSFTEVVLFPHFFFLAWRSRGYTPSKDTMPPSNVGAFQPPFGPGVDDMAVASHTHAHKMRQRV